MIIIEGVDKAGKTTLAKTLSEKLGWPIEKFGIPNGDPIPGYIDRLKNISAPVIFDRFIYGEVPYSIVKKRERYMQSTELTVLDLMVQSIPHLVLYVRPKRSTILDRIMALKDDYINEDEAIRLYDEYDALFENVEADVVTIDEKLANDTDAIVSIIADFVNADNFDEYLTWKKFNMEGIGNLTPTWLFVGERYNPNAKYQATFCSKSGEYLFKCIRKADVNLRKCHFVNALNSELRPITPKYLSNLTPSKVISLGAVADSVLNNSCGIKTVVSLPHPAYWSRFNADKEDAYVNMLRTACF